MKRILNLFIILLSFSFTQAQIVTPVKWTGAVEKISDTEFNLIYNATVQDHWHLYSQHLPEGGALPTELLYDETQLGKTFELTSEKAAESKTVVLYDKVFEMDMRFFDHTATLAQRIKVLDPTLTSIDGEVSFQSCDDEKCLFDEVKLTFDLTTATVVDEGKDQYSILSLEETKRNEELKKKADNTFTLKLPIDDKADAKIDVEKVEADTDSIGKSNESKGLFTIFFLAFLSGFAALLTPCVFPMIPMTVSFFTKQSKSKAAGVRNAIIYGLFIIFIYVFLGAIVTWAFGADALNALSTNVWFNIIFFILLVVFAFSFLGAFEIMLPNSWANKVDSQADRGGMIGIFFMALALAIVSFSCTGPIVGTLLVEAASKGGIAPFVGMFGFSLALALPFTLFAMFPGWLNSLPKSGGWLNTVKVVLGFLELALAFKFLSNADLVVQGHFLEREVFIAIWIAVFGALAFYLFGKIQLPHDSPIQSISVGRLMLGLITLTFTIYLIPGLWGAPLKLISGFPPPMHYSESPYGVGFSKKGVGGISHSELPEGAHLGPHDIIAFHDYETGIAYAKQENKPVLLDFTGHACVNCRKMEERVWSEKEVFDLINNDYVLISLYVDDKRQLPKSEQYVSETTGKSIETIGNKWSDFQTVNYKANAQPYYVLLGKNEEKLNAPIGYTPDVEVYTSWLQEGVENYKK
ncbi:MAG: protein-disulfide reductase DsbD family protein [Flavobacteriaceae bacterium]